MTHWLLIIDITAVHGFKIFNCIANNANWTDKNIGRNACCSLNYVAGILRVTRCMVSRYVDEHISPQLRASALLLLELLFIRDGW